MYRSEIYQAISHLLIFSEDEQKNMSVAMREDKP